MVLLLVGFALLIRARGIGEILVVAALGYAVGLTAHIFLVLIGWEPRFARRTRDR